MAVSKSKGSTEAHHCKLKMWSCQIQGDMTVKLRVESEDTKRACTLILNVSYFRFVCLFKQLNLLWKIWTFVGKSKYVCSLCFSVQWQHSVRTNVTIQSQLLETSSGCYGTFPSSVFVIVLILLILKTVTICFCSV